MNFQQHRLLMESDDITDATEFRVLVALCSFADAVEAKCWAGKEKIARAARLATDDKGSSRAADGAIKRLVKNGHLSLSETGGGARRPNCYQIHIGGEASSQTSGETEVEVETPQEMRGSETECENPNPAFDDKNPALSAGLATKTPHLNTSEGGLTPHLDTFSKVVTPHLTTSHIRTEVLIERNEELDDEEDPRRGQSSSPSPVQSKFPNHGSTADPVADPITLSLCEACALMPDALSEKHRGQLREVTAWLLEIYPDAATAAREVAVRFRAWGLPRPPYLPQIKTDWKRMERILDFQNQPQNPSRNERPIPQTANERRLQQHVQERLESRNRGAGGGDGGGLSSSLGTSSDESLLRLAQRWPDTARGAD